MKSKLVPVILTLSLLVVGCLNRSDPRSVAEAFFRAEMAKDEKQVLAICGNIGCPNQKIWDMQDRLNYTREFYRNGPVTDYKIDGISISSNPFNDSKKSVEIRFSILDKKYSALFDLKLYDGTWYPDPPYMGYYIMVDEVR